MPRPQISLTHDGRTHTLREWSHITGIPRERLKVRHYRGLSAEDILFPGHLNSLSNRHDRHRVTKPKAPIKQSKRKGRPPLKVEFDGKRMTYAEWSAFLRVEESTLRSRNRAGLPLSDPPKQATPPVKPKPKPITRSTPVTLLGQTKPLDVWAYELSVPLADVLSRFNAGEPAEACFSRLPRDIIAARKWPSRDAAGRMRVPSVAEVDAHLRRLAA